MEAIKRNGTSSKQKSGKTERMAKPVSLLEQAIRQSKHEDMEWLYERQRSISAQDMKPAGGLILPNHLKEGGNRIIHKSFNPRQTEFSSTNPFLVGRKARPTLKRFNGRKIQLANFEALTGTDNRYVFYDNNYPWRCTGRISSPGKWGSATLVGRNFVITASHVVAGLWTPGQPLTASITFVPDMFDGSSILGAGVTAQVTGIAAWEEIDTVAGYDMAICQLDQPLGDWLGYFGSRGFDNSWENQPYWSHVGYPYDLSANGVEPSFQQSITVYDDDSDEYDTYELETDADIASGQSGGPLFAYWDDGGYQVIGVLSGHENAPEDTNIFAGGSGLNSLVSWGRANW